MNATRANYAALTNFVHAVIWEWCRIRRELDGKQAETGSIPDQRAGREWMPCPNRETEMIKSFAKLAAGSAMALAIGAGAAQAVEKISAVHAFPPFLVYTQTFLAMVEDINKRAEGVCEIEVRGGPEAIGMFQQPAAVRDGVVDMVHVPGSFYGNNVPEIDAMVAAKVTPMEARANGGAALMDKAHQERFNVRHLGWIDGGVKFHIYMNQPPKFSAGTGMSS